jgi:hypothetical protein
MSDSAALLAAIAAEQATRADVLEQQAVMADRNAAAPNLPDRLIEIRQKHAADLRAAATDMRAREQACLDGARALGRIRTAD